VPIFFRSDQVDYYASLSRWVRQDVNGGFADYSEAIEVRPENLLQKKARVTLFSGVDQLQMKILKSGWSKGKGKQYRAAIEINGRLSAKLNTPGIAIINDSNDGYQQQIFSDLAAAEAFLHKNSHGRDRLVVGLQIPAGFVKRLFPEAVITSTPETLIGCIAVSGPSYGPTPKVLAGVDDLNLELLWKSASKD